MKRFVKVNSEITGGNRVKSSSNTGLSSRAISLKSGNSGILLGSSSIVNVLLCSMGLSGQMSDHGEDFFKLERLIDKSINPQLDRFSEESVPSFRNDQKN